MSRICLTRILTPFYILLLPIPLLLSMHRWLSRAADREKQAAILQSQAYADYLRAVAASAHLRSDEDLRDAHRNAGETWPDFDGRDD